jgi:hypothetical protein
MLKLIVSDWIDYHVSLDASREFEKAIIELSQNDIIIKHSSKLICASFYILYRLLKKIKIFRFLSLLISKGKKDKPGYFEVLMSANLQQCLPYFISSSYKSFYVFDAWEMSHKTLVEFANDFKVDNVFVSSSQVAEKLNSLGSNCKFHWIPEGINIKDYKFYEFRERNIDAIQIGRKYDEYHNLIVDQLNNSGKKYLFEKKKGELIFPTRADFINGLASSKISICFPSSITHPKRSGQIETLTIRYLQSIASKCIIVGHAPDEMIKIFGYNPVIEADMINPFDQLLSILKNYEQYFQLVEMNYQNLLRHQWSKRWEEIKEIIFA